MQQPSSVPDTQSAETLQESRAVDHLSTADQAVSSSESPVQARSELPFEVGGRDGPEPTRFGDWEKAGRCIDF